MIGLMRQRLFFSGNMSLHTFVRGAPAWGYNQFIKRKELLNPLKCWMTNNVLSINCEVKYVLN